LEKRFNEEAVHIIQCRIFWNTRTFKL